MKRPLVVWAAAVALVPAVLLGGGLLPAAAAVVTAAALVGGARWGRTGSAALCLLALILAWLGGLTERLGPVQVFLAVTANVALLFALLGRPVHDWTGGDRPVPVYGSYGPLDSHDDEPDEGACDEA